MSYIFSANLPQLLLFTQSLSILVAFPGVEKPDITHQAVHACPALL